MKRSIMVLAFLFASSAVNADDIVLIKRAKRPDKAEASAAYTVMPNDNLNKIMVKALGAKPEEMLYLYHQFKLLNPGIKNLNIIHPGQKVVLPKINREKRAEPGVEMKEVNKDYYTVKQGEHLIKILRKVYKLNDEQIRQEY